MSRFYDCVWDGEGPPPEFWQRAALNALHGRRGQAILRELREALLSLPAPRLICGAFAREGEVCALGALAGHRMAKGQTVQWGNSRLASLKALEERLGEDLEDEYVTMELAENMGLKRALAWAIAYENDEGTWAKETPEQRHARILKWIDQHLQEPVGLLEAEVVG